MTTLLPKLFETNWHFPMVDGLKGKEFFGKVTQASMLLNLMGVDHTSTIALYGRNSTNWVAIYLAAIAKGCNLLVIPPNLNHLEITRTLVFTNTRVVFADIDLIFTRLGECIPMEVLINIDNFKVFWEKPNSIDYSILADTAKEAVDKHDYESASSFEYCKNDINLNTSIFAKVITPTAGTTKGTVKWVIMNWYKIKQMLLAANTALPYKTDNKLFSYVDFAESHYITVLLPLFRGVEIKLNRPSKLKSPKPDDILLFDTYSVECMENQFAYSLLSKWWNRLFLQTKWLNWAYTLQIINQFKKLTTNNVIVYNATCSHQLLNTLQKAFKGRFYTTYGTQEACQLVAVNDYSVPELKIENVVGYFLKDIDGFESKNGTCILYGAHISEDYLFKPDTHESNHDTKFGEFDTEDGGYFDITSSTLSIYGRKMCEVKNNIGFPVQLDNIERTLKAIPFVKEAVIVPDISSDGRSTGGKLIVEINPDIIETLGINYLKCVEILKIYTKALNEMLKNVYTIYITTVWAWGFEKTYNNKVVRRYYTGQKSSAT